MRNPIIFKADEIKKWDVERRKDEKWVACRPLPFYGLRLFHNLKIAFFVLIGKYDVLEWE